jgi:hypothetical protein
MVALAPAVWFSTIRRGQNGEHNGVDLIHSLSPRMACSERWRSRAVRLWCAVEEVDKMQLLVFCELLWTSLLLYVEEGEAEAVQLKMSMVSLTKTADGGGD